MLLEKQFEFFDKLHPVLHNLNCYITEIDVWLGETGKGARKTVKNASKKNTCVRVFEKLLDQYYVYIPKDLMKKAQEFHSQTDMLSRVQTQEAASLCIELLFSLRDDIREYIHGKE